MTEPYLLQPSEVESLEAYRDLGGILGLERARSMDPADVVATVSESGLRGRGGAGFPTGTKWASVASGGAEAGDRFVVVNGAEGEPGTFKDRTLLRNNPYQVLEGALIAAHAVGALRVFVAVKASFEREARRLSQAMSELADADLAAGIELNLVRGPEEYLFGEEKALLEVIEGEDPLPRLFPPYLYGLFSTAPQMGWSAGLDQSSSGPAEPSSNPTVVNNVETLANVAPVMRGQSPGNLLVTISGDTVRAGVAEVEVGSTLGDALESIGAGMPAGRSVKAVLSGVANPALRGDQLDTALTHEAMGAAGSGLGAAGFLVLDDTRNMVEVAYWVSAFLYVESCGQCPACKFGTGEVTAYLHQILSGAGSPQTLETIAARLAKVDDAARCSLPAQERAVVASLLAGWPEDVTAALESRADLASEPLISKIEDIAEGRARLDEKQRHKRPDWTYSEDPVVISRS